MKNTLIFLDGRYQQVLAPALKAMSPGFLKGLGVFETLLCEDGNVFFLKEHYQRFLHGCDRYVLPQPPALAEVKNILSRLLRENKFKGGRIRLAAWRQGWELHFAVVVIPQAALPGQIYRRGFTACLYLRRLDRPFQLAKVKSLDYGFFVRAYEYALKKKHQEALFVNSRGQIVEGSRSNIFYVKEGKLFTPSLSCGCLAGVTRQSVLNIAKSLGIKTSMGKPTLFDLQKSEEIFLTNALVGIMPLTALQGYKIGAGQPGKITSRLSKSYKKLSQSRREFLL